MRCWPVRVTCRGGGALPNDQGLHSCAAVCTHTPLPPPVIRQATQLSSRPVHAMSIRDHRRRACDCGMHLRELAHDQQQLADVQPAQRSRTSCARTHARTHVFVPWRSGTRALRPPRATTLYRTAARRLQRRKGAIQERHVHGVGRGRPGEAAAALEALLQQHGRPHLCRRLC